MTNKDPTTPHSALLHYLVKYQSVKYFKTKSRWYDAWCIEQRVCSGSLVPARLPWSYSLQLLSTLVCATVPSLVRSVCLRQRSAVGCIMFSGCSWVCPLVHASERRQQKSIGIFSSNFQHCCILGQGWKRQFLGSKGQRSSSQHDQGPSRRRHTECPVVISSWAVTRTELSQNTAVNRKTNSREWKTSGNANWVTTGRALKCEH